MQSVVVISTWEEFSPLLPFRDFATERWCLPFPAERRRVVVDGRKQWQKRARRETDEEWEGRQW